MQYFFVVAVVLMRTLVLALIVRLFGTEDHGRENIFLHFITNNY